MDLQFLFQRRVYQIINGKQFLISREQVIQAIDSILGEPTLALAAISAHQHQHPD